MIYQLKSGAIVYQSGASSSAPDGPCRKNLTQLDEMMRKTFATTSTSDIGGKAMCCKSNACNAAIPKVTKNLLCSSLPSFLCACTYFRPFLLCSYAETYLHISSLLSSQTIEKVISAGVASHVHCISKMFQIMMESPNNSSIFIEEFFLAQRNTIMTASLPFTSAASSLTKTKNCLPWQHSLSLSAVVLNSFSLFPSLILAKL